MLCAGANYYSHAQEMGTARPEPSAAPFFFFKPPTTTAVVAPEPQSVTPAGDPQFDWEVELPVVIAHRVRDMALPQQAPTTSPVTASREPADVGRTYVGGSLRVGNFSEQVWGDSKALAHTS